MKRQYTRAKHYTDQALIVHSIKKESKISERDLALFLKASKSEVHRLLKIGSLGEELNQKAKFYNVEKWVMVDLSEMKHKEGRITIKTVKEMISKGMITTRAGLKEAVNRLEHDLDLYKEIL